MSAEEHNMPLTSGANESAVRTRADEPATQRSSVEAANMQLMQTLDDAWNGQDLDTFSKRHKEDVIVRWPGQAPTHGVKDHRQEAIDFFKAFPDQHLANRPYRVFLASGDWTCSYDLVTFMKQIGLGG